MSCEKKLLNFFHLKRMHKCNVWNFKMSFQFERSCKTLNLEDTSTGKSKKHIQFYFLNIRNFFKTDSISRMHHYSLQDISSGKSNELEHPKMTYNIGPKDHVNLTCLFGSCADPLGQYYPKYVMRMPQIPTLSTTYTRILTYKNILLLTH